MILKSFWIEIKDLQIRRLFVLFFLLEIHLIYSHCTSINSLRLLYFHANL